MLKGKHILVTGGAGFIGSNIVDSLSADNEVVVLDNLSSGSLTNLERSRKRITFVEGDVRERADVDKAMSGAEYVFHLAANVGNVKSIEEPDFDMEVNIKGTLNVLQAAVAAKIKKLVYSSSAATYGDARHLPIDESHPQNPESPYAASKMAAEKYCFVFHIIHKLPIVALRYFNVYGPRQGSSMYANVIPIFFRLATSGEPLTIFGDGNQTRDFVNVKDIVAGNLLAAASKLTAGVFNIATGKSTSVNELADLILSITGAKSKKVYAPPRDGEVMHSRADITAAKTTLGFKPSVDVADGMRDYFARQK